uniref:glycerate kinase type-2 family protein n=1 Tax=Fulvivirga sp. TaxID=1931237 RepID=UPI00404ACB8F
MSARQDALKIFQAAIKAVQPSYLLPQHIKLEQEQLTILDESHLLSSVENIYVIGAGKAAAAMALETEKILGNHIAGGVTTTKYHHSLPTDHIKIIESAHPVPDDNCDLAVKQTIELLNKTTEHDVVICLISGGASSLWCDVPVGLSMVDLQQTFDLLLKSGAEIQEMNTVRKHLSQIKGGQLLSHTKAKVYSLIISDVVGDDISAIASGPTVPDPSTFIDAKVILSKYELIQKVPQGIINHIEKGIEGYIEETLKPGDAQLSNSKNKIIGNNQVALDAAKATAQNLGYLVEETPELITGDAVEEASKLMGKAINYNGSRPACLLQGGETTVMITGQGKGGRNQHFALSALRQFSEATSHITILSGGTDGTDGPTDATGAVVDISSLQKAKEQKLDINKYHKNQDAYNLFKQTDDLIITGPTQTNVMDVMFALIQ